MERQCGGVREKGWRIEMLEVRRASAGFLAKILG